MTALIKTLTIQLNTRQIKINITKRRKKIGDYIEKAEEETDT